MEPPSSGSGSSSDRTAAVAEEMAESCVDEGSKQNHLTHRACGDAATAGPGLRRSGAGAAGAGAAVTRDGAPYPHVCYECGASADTLEELQLHMARKTAWSNRGLVGCRVSCLLDEREWQEARVAHYQPPAAAAAAAQRQRARGGGGGGGSGSNVGAAGLHLLEFRNGSAPRWIDMRKAAFFIVERAAPAGAQECKEPDTEASRGAQLAPLGEPWDYCEALTPGFCAAQSTLHHAYGGKIQETGHKTEGHLCVTDSDRDAAKEVRGSLLYGELLPRGVNKALGTTHLHAASARVVYDLGMGTGKVALQAFLQHPHLARVYGVELSQARYLLAERALQALVDMYPLHFAVASHTPGRSIAIHTLQRSPLLSYLSDSGSSGGGSSAASVENSCCGSRGGNSSGRGRAGSGGGGCGSGGGGGGGGGGGSGSSGSSGGSSSGGAHGGEVPEPPLRRLEFECGNLFATPQLGEADIVMLETDLPPECHPSVCSLLHRLRAGARVFSYHDLRKIWGTSHRPFPFVQVEVNRPITDRFPTSWSVQRGHHFFLWVKTIGPLDEEETELQSPRAAAAAAAALPLQQQQQQQPPSTPLRTRSRLAQPPTSTSKRKGSLWWHLLACLGFEDARDQELLASAGSSGGGSARRWGLLKGGRPSRRREWRSRSPPDVTVSRSGSSSGSGGELSALRATMLRSLQ